ncbi:MAG: phosphoribosyltransferase [Vicinamibacterales bacterium]
MFQNRAEAAQRLAERLASYRGQRPLVLAIPRGAVPMGQAIAKALDGDLDVVLVRKLPAPFDPEIAIGSIDESGATYLDPDARGFYDEAYLGRERERQLALLHERRRVYTGAAEPLDPAGRVVIVVDDGIATGSTMIAALRAVRTRQPVMLVAAAAVSSWEALRRVKPNADDVVCVETPDELGAVGVHFRDFPEVSDEEVVDLLRRVHRSTSVELM